jgi:glycosyltransferase involved in cell wall biosynthesis
VISPAARGQRWREVVDGIQVYRFPQFEGTSLPGRVWEYLYSTSAIFVLSLLAWACKGFDVIHAANPPDTLVFVAAFHKLFGKRFIFDHHDLSPDMYCAGFGGKRTDLAYHALAALEKLSCRLADHVIATNESYREIEMERGGVPRDRITVVRNGPPSRFCLPVEPDPALRPAGKTVLAYAGLMGPQDGLDRLLRALRHLAYDLGRTDFICYLMGKGSMYGQLQDLTMSLGLSEYVRFTGFISDKERFLRYLASADICVDPDPSNGYNDRSTMVKIAEYMALGKPIVAFDLRETRFTAQDSAVYVKDNNEMEFARALAALMDDPERRKAMGESGRHRAETELTWRHSATHLLSAYRSVLHTAFGNAVRDPKLGSIDCKS